MQTNALTSLSPYQPAREDEAEVLALTQQFRLLFPQWAEEQLQQQAASTNEVSFTEVDRDLIARTADAIVPLLAPPVKPEAKREVMEKLLLIREHLPKNPNSPQSQPQQQPQQQPRQQQQSAPQLSDQEPPPQEQQSQQDQAQQQEKAKQEDLQALLQKADDRNREHEREKQRLRRAATPQSTRDW